MIIKIEAEDKEDKEDIQGKSYKFFCGGTVKDSTEDFACSGCNMPYRILLPLNGDGKCPSGMTVFKLEEPQPIPKIGLKILGKSTVMPHIIWEIINFSSVGFISMKHGDNLDCVQTTEHMKKLIPYLEPGQPVLYKGTGFFIKKMERQESGHFLYHLLRSSWLSPGTTKIVREVNLPTEKQLLDVGFNPDKWWCV